MLLQSSVAAVVLAVLHLVGRRLTFLSVTPRSVWLSAAGGVSVAYVFLHLLPELHEGQHALAERGGAALLAGNAGIYLVALGGLVLFYGLERLALRSRREARQGGEGDRTTAGAFALHIGSFAAYNLVIGYLLLHGERDNLALYTLALGLHFIVNDHGLREHHKARYDAWGRWLLAAAVLGGWALGLAVSDVPEHVTRLLVALIGGGVILNVMKEELPEQRESRFAPFLAGAAVYGALLLAL